MNQRLTTILNNKNLVSGLLEKETMEEALIYCQENKLDISLDDLKELKKEADNNEMFQEKHLEEIGNDIAWVMHKIFRTKW